MSKLRIATVFCTSAIFISSFAQYAFAWWQGYFEQSYKPLVHAFFISIGGLCFLFLLFSIWIYSLIVRRKRLEITGFLALALLLEFGRSSLIPAPFTMIAKGLHQRLIHDNAIENLRSFAQEFNQLSNTENKDSFSTEELAKLKWSKEYPFLSWVKQKTIKGPTYVNKTDQIVSVRWGGALPGHWGFSIHLGGKELENSTAHDAYELRLARDILVIYED